VRGAVPGHDLPPRLDERRDDQWLGVSVDSQGPGSILIAPRVRSPLFMYTMCSNIVTLKYVILNESVLSRKKYLLLERYVHVVIPFLSESV
jgi:hypothetical protein